MSEPTPSEVLAQAADLMRDTAAKWEEANNRFGEPHAYTWRATTGSLLSPDLIDGIYKLLNHMTGDDLMTHQLTLAADAMTPELLLQHPWLAQAKPPRDASIPDLMAWFNQALAQYGESHMVTPAPWAWGRHDPIQDFRILAPNAEIIAVASPEESP